jgi:hypothetical protein
MMGMPAKRRVATKKASSTMGSVNAAPKVDGRASGDLMGGTRYSRLTSGTGRFGKPESGLSRGGPAGSPNLLKINNQPQDLGQEINDGVSGYGGLYTQFTDTPFKVRDRYVKVNKPKVLPTRAVKAQ